MAELVGWELLFTLLGLYLLAIFVLVIIPACFGISIGVRYLYMRILLKVFDFGRRKIESRQLSNSSLPANGFIEKSDEPWSPPKSPGLPKSRSFGTFHKEFHMEDLLEFLKCGSEAIIDDEVTKRFGTEEIESWNLLTRTNQGYAYISFRLTVVWVLGFFFRYFILLPVRLSLAIIGISFLFFSTFILAKFPETTTRKWLDNKCMLVAFRIMARALSVIVTYHNRENKAKEVVFA